MIDVATEMAQLTGIAGNNLLRFLAPHLERKDERTEILKVSDSTNLLKHKDNSIDNIINLQRVNNVKGINNYFRVVNAKLHPNGSFTGCVETLEQRKSRLFKKYPAGINTIYYMLDFVFKRVFPKFKYTKKFYLFVTNGRNRALSKSEVLGRLVYCGFEI